MHIVTGQSFVFFKGAIIEETKGFDDEWIRIARKREKKSGKDRMISATCWAFEN